jgi:hypothetical protein
MPNISPADHTENRHPEMPPSQFLDQAPRPCGSFETRPSGSSTTNDTGTQDGGSGGAGGTVPG